jgi:hypothetical protein
VRVTRPPITTKRPPSPRTEDSPPPKPTAPQPDCDPPFSVDATGHKRFKLECVAGK